MDLQDTSLLFDESQKSFQYDMLMRNDRVLEDDVAGKQVAPVVPAVLPVGTHLVTGGDDVHGQGLLKLGGGLLRLEE